MGQVSSLKDKVSLCGSLPCNFGLKNQKQCFQSPKVCHSSSRIEVFGPTPQQLNKKTKQHVLVVVFGCHILQTSFRCIMSTINTICIICIIYIYYDMYDIKILIHVYIYVYI